MLSIYRVGGSMAPLYAFIVLYGFGFVTTSVPVPIVAHKLFGDKELPAIMGTFMAFFSAGGIFAGPSGTLAHDLLGSYIPAFYLYMGLSIVALSMIFLAMRISQKKMVSMRETGGEGNAS